MERSSDGPPDRRWWRRFFESPDSLRLAFFPDERVTATQVRGLDRLMGGWATRRVLDLCCGPGRHLAPLARLGYPLIGLDASAFMLDRARSAARSAGIRAGLVRAEAERLPFADRSFDAVLCLFNSFGYLSDEGNQAILQETARCLEPGGRFLLDTRNRAYQLSHLPFSEVVPLEGGGAVWLECTQDAASERLVSVFRQAGSGRVLYRASIRCYTLNELENMLRRAGLAIEAVYGGYNWRPFRGKSREVLTLARKV
jgi:SAM-dependent methyltransferase